MGGAFLTAALNDGATAADAMVNIGSGLLEAVAILLLVERRLRQSEVAAILNIPRSVGVSAFLLWPNERKLYRYTRTFLTQLEPVLAGTFPVKGMEQHAAKFDANMLLLGPGGSGKTTWVQLQAAKRARSFLRAPKESKTPVIFPMRNWLPDRTLEQALEEHVARFSTLGSRAFRKAMKNARFLVVLDGADERPKNMIPGISNQFDELRKKYPDVPWVVTSRSDRPNPVDIKTVVTMEQPTDEEVEQIIRVRKAAKA
jgi:hypothetical protein